MLRAVVDTNVLFEGLTSRGDAANVLDRWVARDFVPCVSTALALEYDLTPKTRSRSNVRTWAVDWRSEWARSDIAASRS